MDKRYIAGWQLSRSNLKGKKEVIMWILGSNRTGKTYRAEKGYKLTLASMLYGVESFHSCHCRVSTVGNCIESSTFARCQSASEESSPAWQRVGLNLGVWPNSGVMSRVRVEGLNSWVEFEFNIWTQTRLVTLIVAERIRIFHWTFGLSSAGSVGSRLELNGQIQKRRR